MGQKVIIIGAGGHAKVIADIILKNNDELIGFLDDNIGIGKKVIEKYNVIGKLDDCIQLYNSDNSIKFIIGIGDNKIREKISKKYNLPYYTAMHPTSTIGLGVKIKEGTAIMANTTINVNASIGKHCIINTGAIIEHDNEIEDFVHVSPNAAIAGTVKIGKRTHVGIGACIKNNISVCEDAIIGAGAVVVNNIEVKGTYMGIPAKLIK